MAKKRSVKHFVGIFIVLAVVFLGMALFDRIAVAIFGPGIMSNNPDWQSTNTGSSRSGDEEDDDSVAHGSGGDDE